MKKQIKHISHHWDFRQQLTLVFIVGVVVLAVVTSLAVSRISTDSVRDQMLQQGIQVTESFAKQSKLAVLYRSADNATEAIQATLGFPNVIATGIYNHDGEILVENGEIASLGNVNFNAVSQDTAVLWTERADNWQFVAPIFAGAAEESESPFEIENAGVKPELEGYVAVVIGNSALEEMADKILQGNITVSLGIAVILLLGLLSLSNRVTKPLKQLSTIMWRAEQGEKKLRADIRGPKDIINMQHAFNTMMAVLERRELELLQAKDAALESARVKGEFAANVSHELRTPMNAVLGMLDLLMTMGLSPKQREYIETAKSSGEVLLELIDDVLDFSKVESGVIEIQKEETYLEDLMDEVVGLMSNQSLKKKIDLGYVSASNVPQLVYIDAARIRQVLINLIGNAIKFTERGEVAIYLEMVAENAESDGTGEPVLCVSVRDTGIGIPQEAQEKIFDSFTQADSSTTREYGGTGLGLAISRRIVQMLGGDINVSSIMGEGSTFSFTVPLANEDIISVSKADRLCPEEFRQLRVLTIDNSEIVQRFLAKQLGDWGVGFDALQNGLSGLDKVRKSVADGQSYDIVILDEDIAGLRALDFIKLLADEKIDSQIKIIVLVSPWSESKNYYPNHVVKISKPLRAAALFDALRKATDCVSGPSPEQEKSRPMLTRLGKRTLVADDNRANQKVAVAMLERLGCEVTVAGNGAEALQLALRNPFDLVLMDCQMPVMDGYEATQKIRKYDKETARLPIIAMTANNSAEEKQRCMDAGMDGFLPKPLRLEELQTLLATWFAEDSPAEGESSGSPITDGSGYAPVVIERRTIQELRSSVGEVVDSMIKAFLEDTPVYLKSLKHSVATGDAKQLRELAHTVKGSAANFGATEVVALSKELEEIGGSGSVDTASEKLAGLFAAFERLSKELENELQEDDSKDIAPRAGLRYTILIADDDRSMRMALRNVLEADEYVIEEAKNGNHAIEICNRKMPDLVLLDALMPEMDGFSACERIRELPNGGDIPILMITALDDEESIVKAFNSGASDYIPKPVHFSVMKQRVSRLLKASKIEKHVKKLAYHDPLTDLPNRAHLLQQLRLMINRASLNKEMVAVLFMDLDRFKMINDSLGHDAGDLLLKAVADRIRRCLREQDFVARLGGDEFTVVLEGIESADVAAKVAEKICNSLSKPFVFLQQKMFVTTSVGISVYPKDGADVTSLLKHADSAMFSAKDQGNGFHFYEEGMEDDISRQLELERELRQALESDELVLHYQPQIEAATGKVVSAEALVRWNHPRLGLLLPGSFVPLAEESDLITELGHWVFKDACRQIREWSDRGIHLRVAVNFSGRELQADRIIERIGEVISEYDVPTDLLELEITESMLLEHHDKIVDDLTRLKEMGITLAIDDFGSGYSSLNYLKRLPVDVLKIDRAFVNDLDGDHEGQAIVKGIVALADSLGLTTVAEGVETKSQESVLKNLGCKMLQGFLYSKAIPPQEFVEKYLEEEVVQP